MNVPVLSLAGKLYAANLNTFFKANSLAETMASIGIVTVPQNGPESLKRWWSFSTADGSFDQTNNCSKGSTSDKAANGAVGSLTATDTTRIHSAALSCTETATLICICY